MPSLAQQLSFAQRMHGILLVAGTSIGGGMLALPVLTGQLGFVPSLFVYFLCWLFMAATGLLFLEITLWMKSEANIVSMAQHTLGRWGRRAAWALYLFLFYCLTLAYIVGAGELIVDLTSRWTSLQSWQGQLIFLAIFGPPVCLGAWVIGRLNPFLMAGLVLSYLVFVLLGIPYVDRTLLSHMHWNRLWAALPITFTAFAYQGIIPTLATYMHRQANELRQAILIGSFIPLVAYAVWQWLILGIVPLEGPGGLQEAIKQGQTAVQPLKNILNASSVYVAGQSFAFFALATSFFGVTLGLLDFLADGLKVKKTAWGKLWLALLVFIPPFLIALTHPGIFLTALEFAGGFGCALLLGLLPVLMVWSKRYRMGSLEHRQLGGGRMLLSLLIVFVVIELICEWFLHLYQ